MSIERATAAGPEAALDVLRTVEMNLPAITAIHRSRSAEETAAGCDLVDQLPLLCVSSTLDNVYDTDAVLIIDQGGNDVYRNNAGIAPFLPEGGSAYIPIGISIDLAGNDTYQEMADRMIQGSAIATGGGQMGGIGISVDYAGNDEYVARIPDANEGIPQPTGPSNLGLVVGQGGGAMSGSGLLFDLGGNDAYRVFPGPDARPSDNRTVSAQGGGVSCGGVFYVPPNPPPYRAPNHCPSTGALIDTGKGNDEYEVDLGSYSSPTEKRMHTLYAQGAGGLGVGVLVDDGGSDSLSVRSHQHGMTNYTSVGGPQPLESPPPDSFLWAQGAAVGGGLGIASFGEGDTTYSLDLPADELGITRASAQGAGVFGGLGALDDLGGNDTYEMRSEAVLNPVAEVTSDCGGATTVPCKADFFVNAHNGVAQRAIYGQGYGDSEGVGLLRDSAGNDTYRAANSIELTATLIDNAPADKGVPSMFVEGVIGPVAVVQGAASVGATGFLTDAGGTDTYSHQLENITTARVESHSGRKPVVTALDAGRRARGQGFGTTGAVGVLLDLGGSGDRVNSSAVQRVSTPDPNGAFQWGGGIGAGAVQGAGDGGALVMMGTAPAIVSSPSKPACVLYAPANHGFSYWHECSTLSVGTGPSSQTWDPPAYNVPPGGGFAPTASGTRAMNLRFTDESATTIQPDYSARFDLNTPRVPVVLRVTRPDGSPIQGQVIHLILQFGACSRQCPAGEGDTSRAWIGLWQSDPVTDADGIVRAELPAAFPEWTQYTPPPGKVRVVATYDGGPGLFPMHEARVLTIGG
jgi:hypothetical protein